MYCTQFLILRNLQNVLRDLGRIMVGVRCLQIAYAQFRNCASLVQIAQIDKSHATNAPLVILILSKTLKTDGRVILNDADDADEAPHGRLPDHSPGY